MTAGITKGIGLPFCVKTTQTLRLILGAGKRTYNTQQRIIHNKTAWRISSTYVDGMMLDYVKERDVDIITDVYASLHCISK